MSAAPSLATAPQASPQRVFPRHPINVPLDVIILRSGIPDSLPGRCTDLSEGGVGAVVAGELTTGQPIGVELRLPNVGLPVRARALVRYHDQLRCGLQFVGLSAEQCSMIRYWAYRNAPAPIVSCNLATPAPSADPVQAVAPPDPERSERRIRVHRRRFYALLLAILMLGVFGWWEWQRAWHELEAQGSAVLETPPGSPLRVSSETMEQRILHKVDPVYPEAARVAGTQGIVILDVIVAPDGTVKHLRPVSGPDLLARSALDAVQFWRFEPYRSAGVAVDVETTITVEFQLN
jgi:TonB family protein